MDVNNGRNRIVFNGKNYFSKKFTYFRRLNLKKKTLFFISYFWIAIILCYSFSVFSCCVKLQNRNPKKDALKLRRRKRRLYLPKKILPNLKKNFSPTDGFGWRNSWQTRFSSIRTSVLLLHVLDLHFTFRGRGKFYHPLLPICQLRTHNSSHFGFVIHRYLGDLYNDDLFLIVKAAVKLLIVTYIIFYSHFSSVILLWYFPRQIIEFTCLPMSSNWIVIGIGGATSSGKTTVAKELQSKLPGSILINQDDFFFKVGSPQLEYVEEVQHYNWDVISAIDTERFVEKIQSVMRWVWLFFKTCHLFLWLLV